MATLTSPTAQSLIANVRAFLGEQDENNSLWSNAEIVNFLNEGIRRYFGEVVQNSEGQFTKQTDLDIVSGTDTIALPADFFEVVRLYRKVGNEYIILPYDNAFNESYTNDGPGNTSGFFSYYFRGNNLVLRNVPTFSETAGLRLEYIAFPETLVTGGDVMTSDVSPVFKDLIEMYAVYKAKLAESIRGNNVDMDSKIKAHVSEIYSQFKDVIKNRSAYPHYTQAFNPEFLD